jgi:phosphatidylglycerophosphate synthase
LRRSLSKDADGPVSRLLNRPLSTRLSMLLAPLRPAPDLVSLAAFALGLAGAALLTAGQGLAGALLVHASSVADGVDGEVARLQLRGGPRGALLDGLLDRVGDTAILAGLGLWALDGHDAREVLALTVAATTGALLSMASKDRAAALRLHLRRSGRSGGCWPAATGGCSWSPWARSWAPVAALAATTSTSALSLGLRVAFLRRPPARDVGSWS